METEKVVVHLAEGRGYVWNASDVKLLRERHRFIGALIGPNTGNTHQEHLPHSLPLLLLPEELQYGCKKEWFVLAPQPPVDTLLQEPLSRPTPDELEKFAKEKVEADDQEAAEMTETQPSSSADAGAEHEGGPLETREQLESNSLEEVASAEVLDESGLGLSQNSRSANGTQRALDSGIPAETSVSVLGSESNGVRRPPNPDEEAAISSAEEAAVGTEDSQAASAPTEVCSKRPDQIAKKKKGNPEEDYWLSFADSLRGNTTIIKPGDRFDASSSGLEDPHQNESDNFVVYEDMYTRGYTITSGTNFGGHFLAYAGDPCDYHSEFVVRVLPDASRLSFANISAASRVALTARKKFLLALVTREAGGAIKVQYVQIAPDLITSSGINRGLKLLPHLVRK